MNSLNRTIKPGEIVVVKAEILRTEYAPLEKRLFKVSSGFGLSSMTSGTGIYGEWIEDGEKDRIEGHHINKYDTIEYQKVNS